MTSFPPQRFEGHAVGPITTSAAAGGGRSIHTTPFKLHNTALFPAIVARQRALTVPGARCVPGLTERG